MPFHTGGDKRLFGALEQTEEHHFEFHSSNYS